MAKEVTRISFDQFVSNVPGVFERVLRKNESVVIEKSGGERVMLKAIRAQRRRHERTEADYKAFLASAGGWKDLVDTEKLKEDTYESRRVSSRPPVEL